MIMTMKSTAVLLWFSQIIILLLLATPVQSERDTLSANVLAKYWIDARDVLEELDNYQALWIKVHGCV
jgi:hypothetical protein